MNVTSRTLVWCARRRVVFATLLSVTFLTTPAALFAQGRRADLPGSADPQGVSPGELQRLFDAYVVMQAQEALQLNESQYPQFLARLKALQDVRRRTQAERQRIVQELRRLVQSAPGGEAGGADARTKDQIADRIKVLRETDSRAAAEVLRAVESLDEVLDPVQQARLRILEEQMERRKLELLMRARQANRPRPRP